MSKVKLSFKTINSLGYYFRGAENRGSLKSWRVNWTNLTPS